MQRQVRQQRADIDSLYELVENVDRKVDTLDDKVSALDVKLDRRLATSPNSTRSNREVTRRFASSLVIAVSMPSRRHSPSSTSVPPSGREQMKLRSDPVVALSAAAGSSSRDSDMISRSTAG
ncbi:MAG: hypothetical protein L0I24_16620 [Pseudonocardia sp.]|nr:hypothetical protein [Pseudonocardia sp.]